MYKGDANIAHDKSAVIPDFLDQHNQWSEENLVKNPKVLLLLNELDWFWSHRLPLAKAILDRNWHLSLTTHDTSNDPRLTEIGIDGYDIPRMNRPLNPLSQIRFMWSLYKVFKETKPDIVHAITLRYAFYAGIVARLMGYKPVISTIAGLGSLYSTSTLKMRVIRAIATPFLNFAFGGSGKFVIFQNPDNMKSMLQTGTVAQNQAYLIRGSGVDLNEFPHIPYEENGDIPTITFASRLLREKGISDFIEAAKYLKNQGFKANFIVAGTLVPGNKRFISAMEIEQPDSDGIVEWRGKVTDMPKLMQESMIVVLPSYYGEGIPKVLLEAAATGRPIISCDVPGCREIVNHDVNGILMPPKNPILLARAIEELVTNEPKRQAYGRASRELVESDFNSDYVLEQTMEIYRKATSQID